MTETGAERPGLGPCMEALEALSEHPEQLLSVQEGLAAEFTQLTKGLYDLLKSDFALEEGSPLKELVIENFDEEQIWQQLELQNSAVLGHFKKVVGRTVKDEDLYLVEPSEDEVSEEGISEEDPELDTDSENEETPGRNHKPNGNKKPEKTRVEEFSDDNSDIDFDIGKQESQSKLRESKKTLRRTAEKSIVDDQFFKLSEMEAFLEAAEKDDDRKDDDDEEGVDYFEDIESGYDEDEEEEEEEFQKGNAKKKMTASSRDLHYKDYFDPVEDDEEESHPREDKEQHSEEELLAEEDIEEEMVDDDEDEEMIEEDEEEAMEETEESKKAKEAFKRVTFDLSDDSEGEDIGDILGGNKKQQISEPNEPKSSFEKREEKITEKIQVMQNQMMEEKSWQLRGEVTAQKRPENSLLAETLLFDHASRMAPTVTEETTVQLEDIIKQRIKDQVWDDVVRKEKPKENAFEYKKRLTLDHDKSKLSLAEIYEQEYVKLNQEKKEEEENPKHVEIQKMLDSLFLKLDALSNFHFTPKPPVPEIKVVSNVPAISMEEVAPVSVSDAALLAPEEVKEKNKAGDVKTSAEKTETDKKRERRKKKAMKKQKIKEREERQQLAQKQRAEKGKKYTKEDAAADLKKITKEGKATVLKDEGKDKALKSSQAFFSQLQDQVKLQIKGVKLGQKKQKTNALSVQKLKL